jgi:glycerol uptake facilitator protein
LWAEFFGVFIIIAFGDGVVAMLWALVGSGRSSAGPLVSSGDWLLIAWGWGFAVTFAVYVTGGISGAHLNPAVSFGAAIRKQLPWNKFGPYVAAQVFGAFIGAALVFLVYNNAINHFNEVGHCGTVIGTVAKPCVPIVKGTAASLGTYSTFATFPAPYFHSFVGPHRRDVLPRPVHLGGHRRVQLAGRLEPGSVHRRSDRRGGRDLVRRERRLRDQSGP